MISAEGGAIGNAFTNRRGQLRGSIGAIFVYIGDKSESQIKEISDSVNKQALIY